MERLDLSCCAARAADVFLADDRRPEAAAGDRHGARPCASARRSAGARRLCPRRRSNGGGAPARAGRSVSSSRACRPHAAPARRDRAARRLAGRRADRRFHRRPRAAPAGRARRDGRHAGAHPCAAAAAAASPIPRQKNPFLETLEAIEQNAMRFLDKAVPDSGARAEIAEELRLMRGMALAFARRAQPLTVALADTHPGNFIVDRGGHRLVRRSREGPCRLAGDRSRACNACNLDAVASRCRQSAVTRRGAGLLRPVS